MTSKTNHLGATSVLALLLCLPFTAAAQQSLPQQPGGSSTDVGGTANAPAVAEEPDHVARLDVRSALQGARDRGQMEIPGEQGAVAVGDAHEAPAPIGVGSPLHDVDHPFMDRVHVLSIDLSAEIDPAMTVAALAGPVARSIGAEDPRIEPGHAAERTGQRMDPGVPSQRLEHARVGGRPGWPEPPRGKELGA